MSGTSDDKKAGGGNPLARRLLAKIGDKPKAPEAKPSEAKPTASKPAPGGSAQAPKPQQARAVESGDMLGSLVSALKQAAPNFGKEAEGPRRKPEGYDQLKAARGGRGIGPGAMASQSKAVQAALIAMGVKIEETGVYDEATEEAVRRFQREQGLERRSGVVDKETMDALDKALGLAPSSRVNVTMASPTEGTDEDRAAPAPRGPSRGFGGGGEQGFGGGDEDSDEPPQAPSRRVGVSGGLVPGMGGGLGVGVDIGGFVGGGKKQKGDKGKGGGAPRAPVSSYTPPSDDDAAEEESVDAAFDARGDGRPKGFPRAENEFIDRIAWHCVRAMWETGVPASALISMAILEGSWGDRPLARDGNNLFGLEGDGPAGSLPMTVAEAGYASSTEEAGEVAGGGRGKGKRRPWRKYASHEESIFDMARHMATDGAYEEVLAARGAPERLLRALSDVHKRVPHFGETCWRIYEQHKLGAYDRVRPG